MKRFLPGLLAMLAANATTADVFTDDFNRAATAASTNVAESVGPGWANGGNPSATFSIADNKLDAVLNPPFLLLCTTVKTRNEIAGNNFIIAATVQLNTTASSALAGLFFNYVDPNNYYALRFAGNGTVQLIRVVNGTANAGPLNVVGGFIHVQNRPYRVSVASVTPYVFDVSITDTVAGTVVFSRTAVTDANQNFKEGMGGPYSTSGVALFDDFRLESSGPARSFGLFLRTSN